MTEPEFYPLPGIALTAWRFAPAENEAWPTGPRAAYVMRVIERQAIEVMGLSPNEWRVEWDDNTIRRKQASE